MNKSVMKKLILIIVFLVIASLSKLYGPEDLSEEDHDRVSLEYSEEYSENISDEVKIVTWNVKDIKSLSDVSNRKNDLRRFAESIRPDILILQEISSKAIVEKMKIEMGLENEDRQQE